MNRYLITKCIKATIHTEKELIGVLEEMCDIVLNESSTNDEKSAAFNTIIDCLETQLSYNDIDNLVL